MDFALSANIAYVLLVLGSILTMLAIVTPGTGLLEIGALFAFALAGFGAFNLGFNVWALILLILMLIPFLYATRKPNREIYLGASILLMIIGSIYLYPTQGLRPAVDPILAILVSLISGLFVWLVVQKTINAMHNKPDHDLGNLLGQTGESKTAIFHDGSVQVDGELWSARSIEKIPQGKQIKVVGRDGFTLLVEIDKN
jgi:membrane-bound serine protease (ClpP class)